MNIINLTSFAYMNLWILIYAEELIFVGSNNSRELALD